MYTVEEYNGVALSYRDLDDLYEMKRECNKLFDNMYSPANCNFADMYQRGQIVWFCRRDGRIVGWLVASLTPSMYNPLIKNLYQDSLYVKPGTRAAFYLMQVFIDFGKEYADHVYTMIGRNTNIKPSSLEKLGFKQVEVVYRLEV